MLEATPRVGWKQAIPSSSWGGTVKVCKFDQWTTGVLNIGSEEIICLIRLCQCGIHSNFGTSPDYQSVKELCTALTSLNLKSRIQCSIKSPLQNRPRVDGFGTRLSHPVFCRNCWRWYRWLMTIYLNQTWKIKRVVRCTIWMILILNPIMIHQRVDKY